MLNSARLKLRRFDEISQIGEDRRPDLGILTLERFNEASEEDLDAMEAARSLLVLTPNTEAEFEWK